MNSLIKRELHPTTFSPLLSTTALALILSACGGGGGGGGGTASTQSRGLPSSLSGQLYDGTISGAKIYIDVNGNGEIDDADGAPIATTNQGHYTAQTPAALQGKTDINLIADLDGTTDSDGEDLSGIILFAPADAKTISSLTHYLVLKGDIDALSGISLHDIKTRDPFTKADADRDKTDLAIIATADAIFDAVTGEMGELTPQEKTDLETAVMTAINTADTAPSVMQVLDDNDDSITSFAIIEGTTNAQRLATIKFTDDGLGVNKVTLTGTNHATYFEIRDTGDRLIKELWLKGGVDLDYENSAHRSLAVNLEASTNSALDHDFTLRVTDIDDTAPRLTAGGTALTIAAGTDDGTPFATERKTGLAVVIIDPDTPINAPPTLLLDGQTTDDFILKRSPLPVTNGMRYDLYVAASVVLEARAYNFTFKHAGAADATLSITPTNTDPGGTVTITPTDTNSDDDFNAGDTITAASTLTDDNGIGTFTYTFYKANANGTRADNTILHTETTTATTATYTIPDTITAQNTQKIRVEVSYTDDGKTEQTVSAFTARAIGDSYNPFIDLDTFAKATTAHSELSTLQTSNGITYFTIDENTDLSSANANQRKINAPLTSETGVTYSVVIRDKDDASLNDNNHPFDFNNGILSFERTDAFDFETHPIYKITITLMKNNHADTPVTFEVRVNDRDEAPTAMDLVEANGSNPITSLARVEGTTTEQKLADVTFEDEDEEDNFLQNTATIPTSQIFQIKNGNELWLRAGFDLDYETAQSHDITVTLTRTGTSNLTHDFTLNVNNTNDETPELTITGDNARLSTGLTDGDTDTNLTFTLTDRDSGGTINATGFNISDNRFKAVEVNSSDTDLTDGKDYKIFAIDARTFAANTAITLSVTYTDATQNGNVSTPITFASFTPADAVTAPVITGGPTASYAKNENDAFDGDDDTNVNNDILVATLRATGGGDIRWSKTAADDSADFRINTGTGALYFVGTSNQDLNNSEDEYTVTVTATNTPTATGTPTTVNQIITFTITNINDEAPTLATETTTANLAAGADTTDRDTGLTFTVTDADKMFNNTGFTITGDQSGKFDIEYVSTTQDEATYKIIAKMNQDIKPTGITLTIAYNDGINDATNTISYTFTPSIPAAKTYTATSSADTFTGSPYNDNDSVSYAGSNSGVTINLATNAHVGGWAQGDNLTSIENIIGSAEIDNITGNDKDNTIRGGAGNDTLNGGDGDDIIEGGAGADRIDGGAGNDTISFENAGSTTGLFITLFQILSGSGVGAFGHAFGDTYFSIENVIGSDARDTINGTSGDNILEGGDGADLLTGEGGNDVFAGDGGSDAFVIWSQGRVVVRDFTHVTGGEMDKIGVDTTAEDESTIAAIKAATNLYWTNTTEIGETIATNDENINDTIIHRIVGAKDGDGNSETDDIQVMVLLDFTTELTIDMFEII